MAWPYPGYPYIPIYSRESEDQRFYSFEDKNLTVDSKSTLIDQNKMIPTGNIETKNNGKCNNNSVSNVNNIFDKIEIIEGIIDPIIKINDDDNKDDQVANEKIRNNIGDDENVVLITLPSLKEREDNDDDDDEQQRYKFNYTNQMLELERLGMTVTSGSVVIKKDETNLIGISIGGGAPLCPCLYIVQVFDGTPAAREGTLESGDELLGVNGNSVKGKTKVEVAKMIQAATEEVTIHFNKLHADPSQGESLDIVLKKIKHRIVESMSSNTADTLGLSRAILCNDSLVKRLQELEATEHMYKGLVEHAKRMLKAHFDLLQTYQDFGNAFAEISVREPQPRASEAFRLFGELHRQMEKDGVKMLKNVKPVLADFGTYLNKAIPDTKMTIRRYADAKFTYLSYCLKVKEMDDEEHSYAALQEPLYRVETGNYEYRLILRCRQEARTKFAKLRNDVLEKMELLESKHSRDLAGQFKRFIEGLATLSTETAKQLKELPHLFPVEVDLKESAFQYKTNEVYNSDFDTDESVAGACGGSNELLCPTEAEEALEMPSSRDNQQQLSSSSLLSYAKPATSTSSTNADPFDSILSGFEEIDLNAPAAATGADVAAAANTTSESTISATNALLAELGLDDIDLSCSSSYFSQLQPEQQQRTSANSNHQVSIPDDEDLLK